MTDWSRCLLIAVALAGGGTDWPPSNANEFRCVYIRTSVDRVFRTMPRSDKVQGPLVFQLPVNMPRASACSLNAR